MKNDVISSAVVDGLQVYPIPGFEEHYAISECGRVYSVPRTVAGKGGSTRTVGGRWLKTHASTSGYQAAHLHAHQKKTWMVHRLLYETFKGPIPPGMVIDHIDRDKANNDLGNLRLATPAQNGANTAVRVDSYKGVSRLGDIFDPAPKFTASITAEGKPRYLGTFKSEEAAARAYDEKARELHGEFAVLNFPDPSADSFLI